MSKIVKIPPSEWAVMEILWNESPLSATEIAERLPERPIEEGVWNAKTVRAFLDRLIRKEAVSRRKIHGMFVFEPLVHREESLRQESRSFLDRFFRGNPLSMISHFVENEELSDAEIERLQKILEQQRKNNR